MKVLIVEDDINSMYLLKTILKKGGYKTINAQDGAEALKRLKKNKIDIIISDILMPKMDGFQLCRKCKGDDKLRKILFLFYTATYKRKQDEEFALSLGAEKFIIKPREPDVLLKIMDEIIREHKKEEPKTSSKKLIKEEQYLAGYNRRIIKKLEDKVVNLNKEIIRRKKIEDELYNRIKELNCLYYIANLAIRPGASLAKIFKEIVKFIPAGMKHPEMVCSRIVFNKKEYRTNNFKKTIFSHSFNVLSL